MLGAHSLVFKKVINHFEYKLRTILNKDENIHKNEALKSDGRTNEVQHL